MRVADGPRIRLRAAVLAVVGALAFAYVPLFFGQIIFFRDPAFWNHPARVFLGRALREGQSPLWNPDVGLGLPALGNPLYGVFYPPNWLYAVVPTDEIARLLTWQSFAHLVWGSVGILLVSWRLGAGRAGAIAAALSWGLSGYTTSQWTAGLLLLAGAWVPWCAVGFLGLFARVREGKSVWLGIAGAAAPAAMAFLLGEIFVALMGLGFGLSTAIASEIAHGGGRAPGGSTPSWRWSAVAAGAAVAIACAIAAIVVWPARSLSAGTERANPLPREVAEHCSLHPVRFIEMVAPGVMGDPYETYPAAALIGEPGMGDRPLSFSMYFGAAALAVAMCAFRRERSGRLALFLGALALCGLLIALGKHTPVHHLVRRLVPPLGYMRYPEKYVVLVAAWVSILVGLGARRLLEQVPPPWRRVLGLLAALGIFAALAGALFPEPWAPYMRRGAGKGAAAVALVLAVTVLARRRPRSAAVLLVAGVAVDLAAAAWPLQGFGPLSIANDVPPAATVIRQVSGDGPARPRVYRAEKVEPSIARFVQATSNAEGLARSKQTLIHNLNTTFGVATLPGYDAAVPTKLNDLWTAGIPHGSATMRLLGIQHAILAVPDPQAPDPRPGLRAMFDPLPGARLYRVPWPLPRVYSAAEAVVVDDDDAARMIFDEKVVSGQRLLLAPDPAARPSSSAAQAGRCALQSFENGHVAARCSMPTTGFAVFVEQHAPGWRARVDGHPTPILRANLVMRAVPLPPGEHTVELSYEPAVRGPAVVAMAGVLALVVCLAMGLMQQARRRSSAT